MPERRCVRSRGPRNRRLVHNIGAMTREGLAARRSTLGVAAVSLIVALAAVALPAGTSAGTVLAHHTRIPANVLTNGWSSSNWSGYAVSGQFTSITGRWTVPTASRTSGATYSSSWIGIDGFNDPELIQTGTEQDYYNGAAHYGAWWEILPAPATFISMTVHPGDHMSASIKQTSLGHWTISLTDTTTGKSFSTKQLYHGPLSSAEWILEAPTVNGQQAPLAHYSRTVFDPGTANGASPHLTSAARGVMIQNSKQVSTPSSPDSDADGFAVAYGASTPTRPSS